MTEVACLDVPQGKVWSGGAYTEAVLFSKIKLAVFSSNLFTLYKVVMLLTSTGGEG